MNTILDEFFEFYRITIPEVFFFLSDCGRLFLYIISRYRLWNVNMSFYNQVVITGKYYSQLFAISVCDYHWVSMNPNCFCSFAWKLLIVFRIKIVGNWKCCRYFHWFRWLPSDAIPSLERVLNSNLFELITKTNTFYQFDRAYCISQFSRSEEDFDNYYIFHWWSVRFEYKKIILDFHSSKI